VLSSGGASAPISFPGTLAKKMPMRVPQNGWGMSECVIGVISLNSLDYLAKPTAIGRPIPTVFAKVVDQDVADDGPPLKPGEVGELCIKSVQVLKEYFGKPEASMKTINSQGWLRSGDLATMDKDGDLYLIDVCFQSEN
jgi:long-chain acyl-CoA synthetase